jgi:hypothetical protein
LGIYDPVEASGTGSIRVRETGPWPAQTGLHELGHLIDHRVLGADGEYASISHPDLQEFRDAVAGSEAVKELRSLEPEHRDYYLLPEELWARAYAQYIAKRSGDPFLLAQLDLAAADADGSQWTDLDFFPIGRAIDNLFKKKGWIK